MPKVKNGGGYGAARDSAYRENLAPTLKAFAANYSPAKLTLILFPGGMGSKLLRDEHDSTDNSRSYYTSWLAGNIVLGEPRNLQLLADGDDEGDHYVIPNGYIDFCLEPIFCLQPYKNFKTWCDNNRIQLLVFGFDWRRSAKEAADFFLLSFLPDVDGAISAANDGQKLVNYAFVGHSQGGMVLKLALNNGDNAYVKEVKRAITVASPYYGYGGQTRRFLVGDKSLNWTLADPDHENGEMARIMATMQGGYEFLFMGEQTYADNAKAFCADTDYPLKDYPSKDADNGGNADPYNPQDTKEMAFYPLFNDCNLNVMLPAGLEVAKQVAQRVDPAIAAKFYNIRGVQTKGNTPVNGTVVRSKWGRLPRDFNPDARNSLPDSVTDFKGYGDGVQPAWGARLLQLMEQPYCQAGDQHVITVKGKVEHMDMMSEDSVQQELAKILGIQTPQPVAPWVRPPMASAKSFDQFLVDMPKSAGFRAKSPDDRRRDLLHYLLDIEGPQLLELGRRGFNDLLKGGPLPVTRDKARRTKLKRQTKRR